MDAFYAVFEDTKGQKMEREREMDELTSENIPK